MFRKLLTDNLKNIYWVEKRLLKLFPRMQRAASTRYLKACLRGHLIATQEHVKRLEHVFNLLNEKKLAKKCPVMELIIEEAGSVNTATEKNTLLRDISLIVAAQKIEQYEIEKYNRLLSLSNALGEFRITALLEETLAEEIEADETFTAIKEDTLNDEAFKETKEETEMPAEEELEQINACGVNTLAIAI